MINWMYFPQNRMIEPHLVKLISAFTAVQDIIDSEIHQGSDKVCIFLSPCM